MQDPGRRSLLACPGLACAGPLALGAASPSKIGGNKEQSPEGAWQRVPPLQGVVLFPCKTQGGARCSLALGWLVQGLWPSAQHRLQRSVGIKNKALKGRGNVCRPFRALSFFHARPRAALVARLPWAGLCRAFGPRRSIAFKDRWE